MSKLEVIEYIEKTMPIIMDEYKKKKYLALRPNSLWIVVRKLFELSKDIDKSIRQRLVLKILRQMTSNEYIESGINWQEYNSLNHKIDVLNLDEIEQDVLKEKDCNICDLCFRS